MDPAWRQTSSSRLLECDRITPSLFTRASLQALLAASASLLATRPVHPTYMPWVMLPRRSAQSVASTSSLRLPGPPTAMGVTSPTPSPVTRCTPSPHSAPPLLESSVSPRQVSAQPSAHCGLPAATSVSSTPTPFRTLATTPVPNRYHSNSSSMRTPVSYTHLTL